MDHAAASSRKTHWGHRSARTRYIPSHQDEKASVNGMINLDAGPKPEMVTTYQAGDSDMVFGIFSMLGHRFAPRFADLGDQRFWRADLPDGSTGEYGLLEAIARQKVNPSKITTQWPDMVRVAGSLVTNQVRTYDLLRMFACNGRPTPLGFARNGRPTPLGFARNGRPTLLGQAFAEYGRIDKILHLLSVLDPIDNTYRRTLGRRLSIQESRHRLARKICHGNGGKIRQAYREGQEGRLAALGSVVSAVVLWNSTHLSAIVGHLRAQGWKSASEGASITDEDVARLSPLGHAHPNCLGRYAITASDPSQGLRPLRSSTCGHDDGEEDCPSPSGTASACSVLDSAGHVDHAESCRYCCVQRNHGHLRCARDGSFQRRPEVRAVRPASGDDQTHDDPGSGHHDPAQPAERLARRAPQQHHQHPVRGRTRVRDRDHGCGWSRG
ncbi:Tn3 family transposase [Streptosporangium roseum]|nr:Tn3 family transposase [Streptosporangium roseum]